MNTARHLPWRKPLLGVALLIVLGLLIGGQVQAQAENPPSIPYAQQQATGLLANIQAIAASSGHTCALTVGGGAKCWGNNDWGQLGDGTTTDRLAPVDVSGLTSGVQAITAGSNHTCALTTGGGVKCWGLNNDGQLGDSTTMNRLMPVDVAGLSSGVQAISAGYNHTCAVMSAGGVRCWGANEHGRLGDGTTENRSVPVEVHSLSSGIQGITAGGYHTCALTSAGSVKCWGRNNYGQLGNFLVPESTTPMDVSGLPTTVQAVYGGDEYTCALSTGSGVLCWGFTPSDGRTSATYVDGLARGVQDVAVASNHACALMDDGGVKCWGAHYTGQLGDGGVLDGEPPALVDVASLSGGVQDIAAGGAGDRIGHTCAVATSGIKCWGYNGFGQLGNGTTLDYHSPIEVIGLNSGVQAIAAGGRGGYWTDTGSHTCALTTSGAVKCWGFNRDGQLGDETTATRYTPAGVNGLNSGVQAVATGADHTCALIAGGIKCWGLNVSGQLGDSTNEERHSPVDVTGLTTGVQAITAGGSENLSYRWYVGHTCALTTSGGVKCWGSNRYGQLGDETNDNRWAPADVHGLATAVQAIAAGGYHTCALTTAGGVKCWGLNDYGQLGDSTTISRTSPVDVRGLTSGVRAISAGLLHTCALTTIGGVKCWGANYDGQLGDGTDVARPIPVDVSGLASGVQAISVGGDHTCALTISGGLKCWGFDGIGAYEHYTPVDVPELTTDVQSVSAGYHYTCVLTAAGSVKCWGYNGSGQLGVNPGWRPVDVVNSAPSLTDAAALDSQMPYTMVMPGATVPISINVRNTGTSTWQAGDGYTWRGEDALAGQSGAIAGPVAPNAVWPFALDITAPTTRGTYHYGFMLEHNGVEFGPYFYIEVTVDTDTDGDGLWDAWETKGIDTNGDGVISTDGTVDVNLPAMGADVNKKDVFVEVDWMVEEGSNAHSHKPYPAAIKQIVEAFAKAPVDNGKGINLHADLGPDSIDYVTGNRWGSYGRGSQVPHQTMIGSRTEQGRFESDFDAITAQNFQQSKRAFRYALFAHQFDNVTLKSDCHSGIAPGFGQRFMVSLGCFDNTVIDQAGTFMHELGHTLSLYHGGSDPENNKPNYLSVMNYSFQLTGLILWEGSSVSEYHFDYSHSKLPPLDERRLSELLGIGAQAFPETNRYGTRYATRPPSKCQPNPIVDPAKYYETIALHANGPIDWNCDGIIQSDPQSVTVQADINGNGIVADVFVGHDDWSNLQYRVGSIGLGAAPTELITTPEMMENTPVEMTPEDLERIATITEEPMGYLYLPLINK